MDSDALDVLAGVSELDWSSIKPSIFGTLFEGSLDRQSEGNWAPTSLGRRISCSQ
jgi:hypothetical protein